MSHTPETVTIQVELTDEQAWQLAQFYKRLSFGQVRECACNNEETYTMLAAMGKIGQALREKGYAPR
jgi:hypothetical protein